MSALSSLIEGVPQTQRAATYDALAQVALRAFGVRSQSVTFLGHNSGAAFRVDAYDEGRLLLKAHAPQGEGEPLSPEAILGGLHWLAAMAKATDTPVQTPLQDSRGGLLPAVNFRDVMVHCSLQHWLDGQHVEELSTAQAHDVGSLMGQWHTFSERHGTTSVQAMHYDSRHLDDALGDLRALSTAGLITEDSWQTIEQATAVVASLVDDLGTSPDVFGVIHGDLNPDNIIVADNGAVRFIDLAQLAVAPYLWDLGTALYHYSYQDSPVRQALVAGYRGARDGLMIAPPALQAFVCAAALSNLAFQCSIPERRASELFHTNVQKFATGYCQDLVNGVPFALE
jgi:Ser/Thr protein kinase RdoA (MazF antagonist)